VLSPRWPVVLFDLDGTLVNTIPLIVASYQHAVRAVIGEALEARVARQWIGQTLASTFAGAYPDHASEMIRAYIEFGDAQTPALLKRYPGMDEALVDLSGAGARLGVVTSKHHVVAQDTLDAAGLGGLISLTATMEDTRTHKPDPAPLLLAAARLGVADAGTVVYVGDAVVDVLSAKAAGMDVIAVSWGAGERNDLVAAGPTSLADTVDELRALLLQR